MNRTTDRSGRSRHPGITVSGRNILRSGLAVRCFVLLGALVLAAPVQAVERAAQTKTPQAVVMPAPRLVSGQERQKIIARLEERLNDIQSLKARFLQRGPDGKVVEGDIYLERPGKLRFDYGDSQPFLIVSNGDMLSFVDYEVDQVTRWPIGKTPLGLLVEKEISLTERVEIPEIMRFAGLLKVPVIDPAREDQGFITLIFEESTLELRAWEVTDAQGYLTRVSLVNPEYNVAIDDDRFTYRDPRPLRKRPLQGPRR
mgnify:CR=1 FL=1